jgi:uncharacterized protein YyaL (SSP411 family)
MPNRLASSSSPYLRQHAENPVAWYPWGEEALAEARRTDRPILLSIGYAACHWCHVMAHESFEDAATAALMNDHFVNVKVDREERPDLDAIYMDAVQAMTGQGGWPMTVFLTPDGVPFFGGTYFPPSDRHGLPSFRRVLTSIAGAWKSRRDEVLATAESVRGMYAAAQESLGAPGTAPADALLREAFTAIASLRDPRHEGIGQAPKFPQAMALDFCLRHWARTGDASGLAMAHRAFVAMARGGICDQVGGGFARYSTDARWLVPHFEKMLYDNALLARLGAHLWQATGDAEVRRVVDETLTWAAREMTAPGGGWYASLDADSEGEEGRFYLWTPDEIRSIAGADADACVAAWGVTATGNFEGHNILFVADAAAAGSPSVARAREALYAARSQRVWPGRDEKLVASWNGLMLRAMAEAGRIFDDRRWIEAACSAAEFLDRELVRDNRARRTWTAGDLAPVGFLEDSAAIGLGFAAVYQATFDRRWLDRACALAASCVTWFWDDATSTFHDTPRDHDALITRPADPADNATPAGGSLAAELLLMVDAYVGDARMREIADQTLATRTALVPRMPVMMGHLLGVADSAVRGVTTLVVSGDPADAEVGALLEVARTRYVPGLLLAVGRGAAVEGLSLFEGRTTDAPTAYLCRGSVCDAPTRDPATLAAQVEAVARAR